MTRQEIAVKLREALALMNDMGVHWIKGEYKEAIEWDEEDEPVEYGYCSLGAIRAVSNTPVYAGSSVANAVTFALAEVLPEQEGETDGVGSLEDDKRAEVVAFNRVVTWNDDDKRTWDQVVERFNEAAARQEQNA